MSLFTPRFPGTLRRLALACALGGSGLALADSQPLNLDLPGQSLEATVHALAHESGVAIAADSRVLAGRSAPALQGRYTVLQALRQLLAGSDLVAVEENGVIILRGPTDQGALTGDHGQCLGLQQRPAGKLQRWPGGPWRAHRHAGQP
ncbi:STN domain-containing protein [Pseudomonas sp. AA27]|uniref:STN domain-containing protein n=1 Tax=Pseudomonas sp. AA27 TaxID=2908652 RepID=UPI001F3B498E|nr:STN domain-containing protein [Pseudomonas sp. AA27]MCF1486791.1 STN domain-containing protein [Pseudomonas sp. AA27]